MFSMGRRITQNYLDNYLDIGKPYLGKPETKKFTSHGTGNRLKYAVSSMQGWRSMMEDRHRCIVSVPSLERWSFFGVFDGHGGDQVSTFCADHLLDRISESDDFRCAVCIINHLLNSNQIKYIKTGIKETFLNLDEEMKNLPITDNSGTTAVCALLSGEDLFLVNCGDSRGVLSRGGNIYVSTQDHKPFNPEENERIKRAGGSVYIGRVNGCLGMSRALGGYEYKQTEGIGPCEQQVSPEPDITVVDRDSKQDEFLVLASDGIWDVMSNEDLCDYIRHQLTVESCVENICSSIIDICLHKGSKDNMSVVLVVFESAQQISEEAQMKDSELNVLLQKRVQDILEGQEKKLSIEQVMRFLDEDDNLKFPPGAGLVGKWGIIERAYTKVVSTNENSIGTNN